MSLAESIQNVLTQGIDAAKSIKLAQLQVNDPTLNTVGPYGRGGKAGEGVFADTLATVPPIVWIAGAALLALLIIRR